MSPRVPLSLLGLALCLVLSVVGSAVADPLTDVGDTLAGAGLPSVDVPPVPQVEVPHVGIAPVDGVVDTVNDTIKGATDTVNDVTGDLGGGDTPEPPPVATPPTGTGTDPPGTPVQTGSPAPTETGNSGSSPSPQAAAGSNGSRGSAAGAAAGGAVAAAGAAAPQGGGQPAAPPPTGANDEAPAQSPFTAVFDALPWSLFALIVVFAAIGVAMSVRSAMRARRNRLLRRERGELREDVGALQSALLPAIPARIGDNDLCVAYRPAAGPAAGGDFHDVLALADGRIGIVVGDVCGHGREALANTALVHYTVRAYLEAGLEPREALRLANGALSDKLGDTFVTVLAAIYDPAASTLDYASAGHPTPLIAGEGDRAVAAMTPPPIGVGLHTGLRQTRISVRPGSRIWFFTDGLVEARDADGEMFGREGLAAVLAGDGAADPEALLGAVAEPDGARDDLTAFLLVPGGADGDGSIEEEIDVDLELAGSEGLPRFLAACGLDPGEAERAVDATKRRLRLAGSARIRARRAALGPRWEISGASSTAPTPRQLGASPHEGATAEAATEATATILAAARN
jgi:hypothetical protein